MSAPEAQRTALQLNDVDISSDHSRLDIELIIAELRASYWARNIPRATVLTSVQNSLCFAAYWQEQQIAFARVITDQATFGYLADVFVLPAFQGQGVAGKLVRTLMADPRLTSVRRLLLATRDAHTLYRRLGFSDFDATEAAKFMQVRPQPHYPAPDASPDAQ